MMSNLNTTRSEPVLRPVLRMNCKMLFLKHQRDCGAVKVLLNIGICYVSMEQVTGFKPHSGSW
jgi:hypothetical protein